MEIIIINKIEEVTAYRGSFGTTQKGVMNIEVAKENSVFVFRSKDCLFGWGMPRGVVIGDNMDIFIMRTSNKDFKKLKIVKNRVSNIYRGQVVFNCYDNSSLIGRDVLPINIVVWDIEVGVGREFSFLEGNDVGGEGLDII